ncbi:MAG TPA: hypothetical protein VH394_21960 [Thermoanaerobaculia bacterium]|jgi:hypothetical protein|nr:hypothetical protein [Thermoanaerobaculia bacterium]
MHDLDRTLRAYERELGDEMELESYDQEGPFSESEEMELAAELLSLQGEEELEQFLGSLFKKIGGGLKKVFKPLGKILKPIAKAALPIAGKVAGSFFGGPVGGMIGGKLGSMASNLFEMEMEGMDPGQMEMEVARRVVRLAGAAAQKAAAAPPSAPPMAVARKAVAAAAQQHAPGLLRGRFGQRLTGGGAPGSLTSDLRPRPGCRCKRRGGAWIRRGNRIVLLGA